MIVLLGSMRLSLHRVILEKIIWLSNKSMTEALCCYIMNRKAMEIGEFPLAEQSGFGRTCRSQQRVQRKQAS